MALSKEDKFKTLTGETDKEKVSLFLSLAEEKILEVTNRDTLPDVLVSSQLDLAVALYNRNGDEGESSHNEGGVNRSYISVDEILKNAKNYRISPLTQRYRNAKKKDEEVQS